MNHAVRRSQKLTRRNHHRRRFQPRAWLVAHLQALIFSLGHLYRNFVGSAMTCAVIGITVALPVGMFTALNNLSTVTNGWDNGQQITLYLYNSISNDRATSLATRLRLQGGIYDATMISASQALDEYRQSSGFSDLLDGLDSNPLPNLIVLEPSPFMTTEKLSHLRDTLLALPEVEQAQFDLAWLERLHALLAIAERGVLVMSTLLGLAVLLIVGNTIRLAIFNRREEIAIGKLFGATNQFIRRPFLYSGLLYGLIGGIIACLLVALSFLLLDGPVSHLMTLYNSSFTVSGLTAVSIFCVLFFSTLLGLLGAWFSVYRHIQVIEPE